MLKATGDEFLSHDDRTCYMNKPFQKSPARPTHPELMCENLHSRRHFFKENSQEQKVGPFSSLSTSSDQMPKTTFTSWDSLQWGRLMHCSLAGSLAQCTSSQPVQRRTSEDGALDPAGAACNGRARPRRLSQRGAESDGASLRAFPWTTGITEGNTVWVSLRGLDPCGLPGQAPRETPVTPVGDRSQGTCGHPAAAPSTPKVAWHRWALQKITQERGHGNNSLVHCNSLRPCSALWRSQKQWEEETAERRKDLPSLLMTTTKLGVRPEGGKWEKL